MLKKEVLPTKKRPNSLESPKSPKSPKSLKSLESPKSPKSPKSQVISEKKVRASNNSSNSNAEFKQSENSLSNNQLLSVGDLETIIKNVEKQEKSIFVELAEKGLTWTAIKRICLDSSLNDSGQVPASQILSSLIEKRDRYDFDLYSESINKLFPNGKYNLPYYVHRHADGQPIEKGFFKYYEFWIFNNRDVPSSGHERLKEENLNSLSHITISIKAPGSRNLTSDIDTTLEVDLRQSSEVNLTGAQWPFSFGEKFSDEIRSFDSEVLIQTAIIEYFNQLNLKDLHMSAGESRDSNVYSDGFLNEKAYPKFEPFDVSFDNEDKEGLAQKFPNSAAWTEHYGTYKAQRQKSELAAGLSLLYRYFSSVDEKKDNWERFKQNLCTALNEEYFENLSHKLKRTYVNNLSNVFKIVEDDFEKRRKDIDAILPAISKQHSWLAVKEDKERDYEIQAINQLYVKRLLEVAKQRYALIEIKNNINNECNDLKTLLKKIQKKRICLNVDKNAATQYPNEETLIDRLLETTKEVNALDSEIKQLRKKVVIESFANYGKQMLSYQNAQIEANLMAHEAYTNHSAPYHVVKCGQLGNEEQKKAHGKKKGKIYSRQMVMGSVVQQIGFRLLHLAELQKANIPAGEIAYAICKYGDRVADMLYGDEVKAYDRSKILESLELNDKQVRLLKRLRTYDKIIDFKNAHFQTIKKDMMLAEIKSKDGDYYEKPQELGKKLKVECYCAKEGIDKRYLCLENITRMLDDALNTISEQKLQNSLKCDIDTWLDIAKQIIVATYASRLSDQSKRRLWGCEATSSTTQKDDSISKLETMHWYTDDEMNVLLQYYLVGETQVQDIELLTAMLATDWRGGNDLAANLSQFESQRMQKIQPVKDKILIPINLNQNHWALLYIRYQQDTSQLPSISYFDPFGNVSPKDLQNVLREAYHIQSEDIIQISNGVQQDGSNCGPWVIEVARAIAKNAAIPDKTFDINKAREEHSNYLEARHIRKVFFTPTISPLETHGSDPPKRDLDNKEPTNKQKVHTEPDIWNSPSFDFYHRKYLIKRRESEESVRGWLLETREHAQNATRIMCLHGPMGVGKTLLATHIFYYPSPSFIFSNKWWIDASNVYQLITAYAELGRKLEDEQINYEDKIEKTKPVDLSVLLVKFKTWLETNPGWLLVYDGIKDLGDLLPYLPKKGGHILVTLRNEPNLKNIRESFGLFNEKIDNLSIGCMTEDEAIFLFKKIQGPINQDSKNQEAIPLLVNERLKNHPLSIVHSATYIKNADCTIKKYLDLYDNTSKQFNRDELLYDNIPINDRSYIFSIFINWYLIMDKLKYECGSAFSQASEVFAICAYFASKNIPNFLIKACMEQIGIKLEECSLISVIGLLDKFSLLLSYQEGEKNEEDGNISIHGTLQYVIRKHIDKCCTSSKKMKIIKHALCALIESFSHGQGDDVYRLKRIQLIPHLEQCLGIIEKLKQNQSDTDFEDKNQLDILYAKNLLTIAYGDLRDYQYAAVQLSTLKRLKRIIINKKIQNIVAADILTQVAVAYRRAPGSGLEKCKESLEKAMRIYEKHVLNLKPVQQKQYCRAVRNYAFTLQKLGDLSFAKHFFEQALILAERFNFTKDTIIHAKMLSNFADIHLWIGNYVNYVNGRQYAEQARNIAENFYNIPNKQAYSMELMKTLVNLGWTYQLLADLSTSEKLFQMADNVKRQLNLGANHSWSIKVELFYGILLRTLGHFEKAERKFDGIIKLSRSYMKEYELYELNVEEKSSEELNALQEQKVPVSEDNSFKLFYIFDQKYWYFVGKERDALGTLISIDDRLENIVQLSEIHERIKNKTASDLTRSEQNDKIKEIKEIKELIMTNLGYVGFNQALLAKTHINMAYCYIKRISKTKHWIAEKKDGNDYKYEIEKLLNATEEDVETALKIRLRIYKSNHAAIVLTNVHRLYVHILKGNKLEGDWQKQYNKFIELLGPLDSSDVLINNATVNPIYYSKLAYILAKIHIRLMEREETKDLVENLSQAEKLLKVTLTILDHFFVPTYPKKALVLIKLERIMKVKSYYQSYHYAMQVVDIIIKNHMNYPEYKTEANEIINEASKIFLDISEKLSQGAVESTISCRRSEVGQKIVVSLNDDGNKAAVKILQEARNQLTGLFGRDNFINKGELFGTVVSTIIEQGGNIESFVHKITSSNFFDYSGVCNFLNENFPNPNDKNQDILAEIEQIKIDSKGDIYIMFKIDTEWRINGNDQNIFAYLRDQLHETYNIFRRFNDMGPIFARRMPILLGTIISVEKFSEYRNQLEEILFNLFYKLRDSKLTIKELHLYNYKTNESIDDAFWCIEQITNIDKSKLETIIDKMSTGKWLIEQKNNSVEQKQISTTSSRPS